MTWLMDAFGELSTDRPVTMGGVGPIPRLSMSDYIATEGVEDGQTFRRLMRALDNIYRDAVKERVDA